MTLRSAIRVGLLLGTLGPLSCAAETQDFPNLDDDGGNGGTLTVSGSSNGGSPPIIGTAGTKTMPTTAGNNAFGGSVSTAGSPGKGGSTSEGGKPGQAGAGPNGGAGKGGNGTSGSNVGGMTTGGSGPVGCGSAKEWKSADPTWTAAVGDVVSYMGKKYIVKVAIAYPNAECAPNAPAAWCLSWWMADGSC